MPRIPQTGRNKLPTSRGLVRAAGMGLLLLSATWALSGCRRSRLPPRPDGAAVVLAPETTTEPGLTLSDEVEPNDLLANAQALAPTSTSAVGIAGHLVSPPGAKAKDVDLFRIVVPPPAVVTAEADGAAAPPRQRLAIDVRPDPSLAISIDAMDDQGRVLIASVGTTPGEMEGIANLAVIPGTYFVRVKPALASTATGSGPAGTGKPRRDPGVAGVGNANGTGGVAGIGVGAGTVGSLGTAAYRLTVRLLAFDPGDEIEPNGKGSLAGDVVPGGDVSGYLGWRRDEDWFRLPVSGLPEGSVLSVDLDPPDGVAASVSILDSVEHKMIEQRGRKGDRVAIRNIRLPSSEPSMFVVVRAESGRNLDARYNLRLRSEEAKADAELEPNDTPAHAVPIGDGNFLGYLGPGDVDVYRYNAAMPVELDFEVTPPERVDLKIEVIGEDGTVITKIDAGKRREAERLANLYVAASVLVRLSAGKGDGNLDEQYKIRTTSRPLEAGGEREPNGTTALATPLPDAVTGMGLCFPRGDVDFWLTQTPVGPSGSLAVSLRGIAGLNLEARVQTTTGKELTRFRTGGDSSAPTRVNPGTDGCCLIQVREASGRGANARDRYSLSVTP